MANASTPKAPNDPALAEHIFFAKKLKGIPRDIAQD